MSTSFRALDPGRVTSISTASAFTPLTRRAARSASHFSTPHVAGKGDDTVHHFDANLRGVDGGLKAKLRNDVLL